MSSSPSSAAAATAGEDDVNGTVAAVAAADTRGHIEEEAANAKDKQEDNVGGDGSTPAGSVSTPGSTQGRGARDEQEMR